jgi:hypothetical protein
VTTGSISPYKSGAQQNVLFIVLMHGLYLCGKNKQLQLCGKKISQITETSTGVGILQHALKVVYTFH